MEERFRTFTVLIMKINRYIHRIKTEEMQEFELKSPHVSCLYYLYKSGGTTAKGLCDVCAEDKGAISRSVEYLEEKGCVFCQSGEKKRYNAELILTEKGEKIAEKIVKKIDSVLDQASLGVLEEERSVLYISLSLICNNLENICKKYGD